MHSARSVAHLLGVDDICLVLCVQQRTLLSRRALGRRAQRSRPGDRAGAGSCHIRPAEWGGDGHLLGGRAVVRWPWPCGHRVLWHRDWAGRPEWHAAKVALRHNVRLGRSGRRAGVLPRLPTEPRQRGRGQLVAVVDQHHARVERNPRGEESVASGGKRRSEGERADAEHPPSGRAQGEGRRTDLLSGRRSANPSGRAREQRDRPNGDCPARALRERADQLDDTRRCKQLKVKRVPYLCPRIVERAAECLRRSIEQTKSHGEGRPTRHVAVADLNEGTEKGDAGDASDPPPKEEEGERLKNRLGHARCVERDNSQVPGAENCAHESERHGPRGRTSALAS
mmetsp:Transcript_21242/g.53849  ORF Transcript_21242/g.53849 Transcript_21242/m.53849 type:complete len:340 (+) Transcript_21242:67-1086(+)